MKHNALTSLTAKSLPHGKHADGKGLWLVKREKAHGKWILRLVLHRARREMGLGSWPEVSLAEARRMAEDARELLRARKDPIIERWKAKKAGKPLTVKQAVEGCFEARKAELKGDGEPGQWMGPMKNHVIPKIGNYPIEEIDQHVVRDLLKPIWNAKPESAAKALFRLNLTLKHAAALGLNVDIQATVKARALLGKQRRETEHIPSLPYADAPKFYAHLQTLETVSSLALRFLMLTLARTTEVRLASTPEFAADLWNIPAARTKTNVARRIPLTSEALAVVEAAKRLSPNDFLFPAIRGKPISDMAMAKLMKDRDMKARPHGFRATFRTWAEERTEAPFELKESILGHTVDTGTVAAYQRSDRLEKRRALLEKWETYLAS